MPTRGTTPRQLLISHTFVFQSTCPRGARLTKKADNRLQISFQSTCPRGARLVGPWRNARSFGFQSTCPRGARPYRVQDVEKLEISIHVPTRGTTLKLIISLFFYKYFLYVVPKFMIYLKFGSSASSRTRPFTMNTALESGRSRTSREIDVHSHFA